MKILSRIGANLLGRTPSSIGKRFISFNYHLTKSLKKIDNALPGYEGVYPISIGSTEFDYVVTSNDALARHARQQFHEWEYTSLKLFSILAKDSRVILDIGAYSGIFTIVAAKSNQKASVFAFEINPRRYDQIKQNIKKNNLRGAHAINHGLGSYCGIGYLMESRHDDNNSVSRDKQPGRLAQEIRIETLDHFVQDSNLSEINLMKIDVEGMENSIISGAQEVLKRHTPVILMEALNEKELVQQKIALSEFGYMQPIRIRRVGADARNYLWVPKNGLNHIKDILMQLI